MWKLYRNVLPLAPNLIQHRIQVDAMCCIYRNEQESVSHIFINYVLARHCWSLMAVDRFVLRTSQFG